MLTVKESGKLIQRFKKMFGCDTARILSPLGKTMFLLIGKTKNTAIEKKKRLGYGQWRHKGIPIDFDYVHEETVASGNTKQELLASARQYKKLLSKSYAAQS